MNKLNNSKRSQVTLFAVIGIVVLISIIVSTVILMKNDSEKIDAVRTEDIILDSNTIIRHVESCLLKTEETINEITKNGGELTISQSYFYDGINYSTWCLYSDSKGCENRVFSLRKLEDELNLQLKPVIEDCLNLSSFREQGFKITEGASEVTTAVGPRDITVYFHKSLSFSKGEFFFEHSDYSHKFNTFVGRMFEVANMILNKEIKNKYFDKDKWMIDHGGEFMIEKHRPYPDIVYSLYRFDNTTKEWLELHFAIEGKDGQTDLTAQDTTAPFGWCMEGDICFFNPANYLCDGTETGYRDSACKNTSEEYYPLCTGANCISCSPTRNNGDEWCVYEGATGWGMDYVGTRHYQQSCVNGFIYTEECRDYREEICTSSGNDAICRPNRWKTCAKQSTKSNCKDTSKRDCAWIDTSNQFDKTPYTGDEQIKCVPQVPPGFKFWTGMGYDVCQMNNEWIECDGMSCPQVWSDLSMVQCSRLGDCGFGYTYGKTLGNYSFMTSDIYDHRNGPDRSLLMGPEYVGVTTTLYDLNLPPMTYELESYNSNVFDCTDCTFEDILTRVEEYTEWIASLDMEDVAWEIATTGELSYHTRHFTMCMPFQLYENGDCTLCNDPTFPCTEYKCKSIGNNCKYYIEEDGSNSCNAFQPNNMILEIYPGTVHGSPYDTFEYSIFMSADIGGLELSQYTVPAFSPFQITFNTSHEAQCKKGFIPISFGDIPFDLDFSMSTPEPGFSIEHDFTLYAVPSDYLLSDINQLIDLQSFFQLTTIDTMVYDILDNMTTNLVNAADEFDEDPQIMIDYMNELELYYNDTVKPELENAQQILSNVTNALLMDMDNNVVRIFFNCMDQYGNENENEFFISFNVSDDNDTPEILEDTIMNDSSYPNINPNIEFEIIANEPVECRTSFFSAKPYELMDNDILCDTNYYALEEGYKCTDSVPKEGDGCNEAGTSDFGKIFVKCRDKIYLSNISESNIMTTPYAIRYNDDCSRYP